MTGGPVRVGVMGAGAMGALHLEALAGAPCGAAVALADADPAAAERARARWPGLRVHATLGGLVSDPEVDLVDVVLPHHLHAEAALAALGAGKHVLVEKPIALSAAQAGALLEAAARARRRLLVKSYQRTSPLAGIVRERCGTGGLGPVRLVTELFGSDRRAGLADAGDWRAGWDTAGGGVLFDTGYHFVDLVRHLFGPVLAVTAVCWGSAGRPRGRPEDHASATIELDEGVVATLTCSWAVAGWAPTWQRRIVAESGAVDLRETRESATLDVHGPAGPERSVLERPWRAANVAAVREAVEAVALGRPSVLDADDAIETLRAVLACYRSSGSGKRIVLEGFEPAEWRPSAAALVSDAGATLR